LIIHKKNIMKTSLESNPANSSRIRIILYWVATALIAAETATGSVWDLFQIPFVTTIIQKLGYPSYILLIMGVWKALGVIVLLLPRRARMKEWVYAGLFFIYTGAAVSHLVVGPAGDAIGPFMFTALTLISWGCRPQSRWQFSNDQERANLRHTAMPSRSRIIYYWIATGLVVLPFVSGGVGDILLLKPVTEGMTLLGYPDYFCVLLGVWKVLGAAALLIPRSPRLKEWAYAGIFFDLSGAVVSHLAAGESAVKTIGPLIIIGLVVASWLLRPLSRKLPAKDDVDFNDVKNYRGEIVVS
jgi:uncharacterized membrane protein YphA (DoxX/SURF4 family)